MPCYKDDPDTPKYVAKELREMVAVAIELAEFLEEEDQTK